MPRQLDQRVVTQHGHFRSRLYRCDQRTREFKLKVLNYIIRRLLFCTLGVPICGKGICVL
jgi:hypothetical protein